MKKTLVALWLTSLLVACGDANLSTIPESMVNLEPGVLESTDFRPLTRGPSWAAEIAPNQGVAYVYRVHVNLENNTFYAQHLDSEGNLIFTDLESENCVKREYSFYCDGLIVDVESDKLAINGVAIGLQMLPTTEEASGLLARTRVQPFVGKQTPGVGSNAGQASAHIGSPVSTIGILPPYNGCCEDCYNVHRALGLPESFDAICCMGTCGPEDFPCDPDTADDGCECPDSTIK